MRLVDNVTSVMEDAEEEEEDDTDEVVIPNPPESDPPTDIDDVSNHIHLHHMSHAQKPSIIACGKSTTRSIPTSI